MASSSMTVHFGTRSWLGLGRAAAGRDYAIRPKIYSEAIKERRVRGECVPGVVGD